MTRPRRTLAALTALSAAAVGLPLALSASAAAPAVKVTVQTLHFDTTVGPDNGTHCDVIGDLYTPSTATKKNPAPAVLTTNGFGGSKDDQAGSGFDLAKAGYVVLSYSGLGFGGSGCNIQLDDPDWDGKAAKQLVDFLAGTKAATNGLKINYVKQDKRASDGNRYAHDPRVGMLGGSYGGQVQFAAAAVDPRIDTIIPIITWNDLSYSLAPNNTSFTKGVTYKTPGVEKFEWTTFFFGLGVVDGLQHGPLTTNKAFLQGCLNFDSRTCAAKVTMDVLGYPQKDTLDFARHASVGSYMSKIRIPVLLAQGQADSLFNLQEAAATYAALKAQKTPVKMVWQSWGHSNGTPVPGEWDGANFRKTYQGTMFANWFDYYLKDKGAKPSLDFEYYKPWVKYEGTNVAKAYGRSTTYPVRKATTLFLGEGGSLVSDRAKAGSDAQVLATLPAGIPTSFSEISAVGSLVPLKIDALIDAPGTFASWSTGALAKDLDVVGVPKLTVSLKQAAPTAAAGPIGMMVVFAKLYDIAPDGTKTLSQKLISPARIDKNGVTTIELPGIVHRFAKGHTMQLILAAGDTAYRGNGLANVIQTGSSPAQLGSLVLPTL